MVYKKGHPQYNTGRTHFKKGYKWSREIEEKRIESRKRNGWYENPKKTKEKMRKSKLGEKNPLYKKDFSKTHRANISKANKGKIPWNVGLIKETDKRVRNISEKQKGRIPWNYIDGRSKLLSPARYGDDWEAIRYLVYLRDRFTCQDCGVTMNELKIPFHVHHKISFLISRDNSLNNLITLCPPCHRKIENEITKKLKLEVN